MSEKMVLNQLITTADKNLDNAVKFEMESDSCILAKTIYRYLFDFYNEEDFSGDLIFTWKSPSLVKDGDYIGKRDSKIDNVRVIGNIFPNYKSERKYSLNMNRNAAWGDFPHDYFDIYLDHVAKYAYNIERPQIKEYYPLKRAILYKTNMEYFKKFTCFEDFLKNNYFEKIWETANEKPFSNMKFDEFKKISTKLMDERGKQMLEKLIGMSKNK